MHIKTCNILILFNEVKKVHLLIIKIKKIHEFNVLRLIYGYFPLKRKVSLVCILSHAFTLQFTPSSKTMQQTELAIACNHRIAMTNDQRDSANSCCNVPWETCHCKAHWDEGHKMRCALADSCKVHQDERHKKRNIT